MRTEIVFKETNKSSVWYLLVFSYISSFWLSIKMALVDFEDKLDIFHWFYPDNPGKKGFLTLFNPIKWIQVTMILNIILVSWEVQETWTCIKNYYYGKNKNFRKTFSLVVNVLKTCALLSINLLALVSGATFNILAWPISAAIFLKTMPFILAAAIGAVTLYSLFNVGRHLYRAYKADTREKRRQELKASGQYLVSLIINSLALTLVIFLGIQGVTEVGRLFGMTEGHPIIAMKDLGHLFQMKPLMYLFFALGAVVTLGIASSLTKKALNEEGLQETLDFFKHPSRTIDQMYAEKSAALYALTKNKWYLFWVPLVVIPIEVCSILIKATFRLVALPLQLIALGMRACINKIAQPLDKKLVVISEPNSAKESTKTVISIKEPDKETIKEQLNLPISPPQEFIQTKIQVVERSRSSRSILEVPPSISTNPSCLFQEKRDDTKWQLSEKQQDAYQKLCDDIDEHVIRLKIQTATPKNLSKINLLENIRKKLGYNDGHYSFEKYDFNTSISQIEQEAERISARYYQSFWCEVGRTEKIARQTEVFEHSFAQTYS